MEMSMTEEDIRIRNQKNLEKMRLEEQQMEMEEDQELNLSQELMLEAMTSKGINQIISQSEEPQNNNSQKITTFPKVLKDL